jgi:predicted nucleic acid-binding protein
MMLVDANPILYAEDRLSKHHNRAREWWDAQLSGTEDVSANLVSDAHLAALAVGHNCTLYSTDHDFARSRLVRWENPLRQLEMG